MAQERYCSTLASARRKLLDANTKSICAAAPCPFQFPLVTMRCSWMQSEKVLATTRSSLVTNSTTKLALSRSNDLRFTRGTEGPMSTLSVVPASFVFRSPPRGTLRLG